MGATDYRDQPTESSRSTTVVPQPAVGAYSEDDSDPLEDLVGPLPPQKDGPIRPRGRGAYKASGSNIDAHFAPNYDPTLDVAPEDDPEFSTNKPTRRPVSGLMTAEDDWDMALEALRDRQSWKQSGEERLRAAGLNDEVISRWKQNTSVSGAGDPEANLDNFRWAKSGEGREWDRGKVVDSDGHVEVRPTW
ncbi:hypothetical protein N7539_007711 [Penicillium diatomitis]|uniref:Uncharacterized protein n=1 Tax=Penicillium diatomitis TaxID=2819901 RepID=A0A9X0BND5_9EURO|nr:uncharacterized protein N7539_007711 [Penicillium diatomitis]KAJ5475424.1 hypothetical protein N7539_007711 [Penicillium diatomitis]